MFIRILYKTGYTYTCCCKQRSSDQLNTLAGKNTWIQDRCHFIADLIPDVGLDRF